MRTPITTVFLAAAALSLSACTAALVPSKVKSSPKVGLSGVDDVLNGTKSLRMDPAGGEVVPVDEGNMVNHTADLGVWNAYIAEHLAASLKIRKCDVSDGGDTGVGVKITSLKLDLQGGSKPTNVVDLAVDITVGDWSGSFDANAKGKGPHTTLGQAINSLLGDVLADRGFQAAIGAGG